MQYVLHHIQHCSSLGKRLIRIVRALSPVSSRHMRNGLVNVMLISVLGFCRVECMRGVHLALRSTWHCGFCTDDMWLLLVYACLFIVNNCHPARFRRSGV